MSHLPTSKALSLDPTDLPMAWIPDKQQQQEGEEIQWKEDEWMAGGKNGRYFGREGGIGKTNTQHTDHCQKREDNL